MTSGISIINGANQDDTIAAAAAAIANEVVLLQSAGASEFLFVGVGDVGSIPEVRAAGAPAMAYGRFLSEELNAAIETALAPLGVDVYDNIAFFDELLPVFEAKGINTTDACLLSGVPAPVGAPDCEGYAFFDTVHPTTVPLQLLGDDLVASLVPVPGTSLLLGLGLLIIAVRRRQAA